MGRVRRRYVVDKLSSTMDIVLESISACSVRCKLVPRFYNLTKKEGGNSFRRWIAATHKVPFKILLKYAKPVLRGKRKREERVERSSLRFLVPSFSCTLRRLYVYRKRWKTSGGKSHEPYQPGENGLIYRPLSRTFAKADAQARKRIPGKEYVWNIEASSIRLHSSRSATRKNTETSLLPRHQLHPRGKWYFSTFCKSAC